MKKKEKEIKLITNELKEILAKINWIEETVRLNQGEIPKGTAEEWKELLQKLEEKKKRRSELAATIVAELLQLDLFGQVENESKIQKMRKLIIYGKYDHSNKTKRKRVRRTH